MPTYEYACRSCEQHLEVVQSFSDDPLTTCPSCGGELRKVFGAIGIAFKGSGFYKTDSRAASNSERKSRSSDKADATKTDSGAGSGDTKSDAPAPAPAKTDSAPAATTPASGTTSTSKAAASS